MAKQADYLATWMRDLDIGGALLVGHDLGGGVAQILAVKHPELVRGLVLTNAISYDSWPIPQVKLLRAMGPVVERLPDGVFRFIYANFHVAGPRRPAKGGGSRLPALSVLRAG